MELAKHARRSCAAFLLLGALTLWPAEAHATQVEGYLEVTPTGCSCTIHSVRTGIDLLSWAPTSSDAFWVETRLIAINSNDSAQVGIAGSFHTTIVDNCTGTSGFMDRFWRWTTSGSDNCDYTTQTGDNMYVERFDSSSTDWVMLINGNVSQTSLSLFSNPTQVRAGGKTSRDDLGVPFVCEQYADTGIGDQNWDRSPDYNQTTKTWTTVTNGDNVTRTQQGKWSIGLLPNPFYVEYNPSGNC